MIMTKDIIRRASEKDVRAQAFIYETFYNQMLITCMKYAKDKQEAEDFLQESFLKVFDNIDKYSFKGEFGGWLYRLTRNFILDKIRQNKFKSININSVSLNYDASSELSVVQKEFELEASNTILYSKIIKQVNELTPGYRTVFILYVINGYTHSEIAEKLNITIGTSKSNLSKAKEALRKQLKNLNETFYNH